MKKTQVLGIIRHCFTFIGGMLIIKGSVDAEEWEAISGYAIALVGGIWSIVDKAEKSNKE
jgi:hypothetical protein